MSGNRCRLFLLTGYVLTHRNRGRGRQLYRNRNILRLLLDAIEELKDQRLMAPRVIRTFFSRRVLPLKMRGHPQWEFQGARDTTIESSVPIRMEEVDDLMMTAIGVSTLDYGNGEAPDAFHASNPPLTDRPLIGMVSHPPPVPPSKVDYHCTTIHVVYLHLTKYVSKAHTS